MGEQTVEKVLRETGYISKWQNETSVDIAKNLIKMGLKPEAIAEATRLDIGKVKALYK
jgi:hypothetical protein